MTKVHIKIIWYIYTHRQKYFFGDTVLEVAEGNMWVIEAK